MTIKSLSTNAQEEFLGGSHSKTYLNFVDYYGDMDYADKWISAAFGGEETKFSVAGNLDFGKFDVEGRAGEKIMCTSYAHNDYAYLIHHIHLYTHNILYKPASIRFGTSLLNVWMYVVGLLEKAAHNCNTSSDNADQIANWDKAVALYTGSEAREDGNGNTEGTGFFPYTMTQVECYKFGTCKKGDLSPTNMRIFEIFNNGKENLSSGSCTLVENNARVIKELMTVPLVQGVMRSMYALDNQDDSQETTQGMATAFAGAVLPLVNECSEGSAYTIHSDIMPGKATSGSYEVIKAAFERNYKCLGINCEDIGGLVNLQGDGYLKGAEACNDIKPVTSGSSSGGSGSVYKPPPSYSSTSSDESTPVSTPTSSYGSSSQSYATGSDGSDNTTLYIILAVCFGVLSFVFGFLIACICVNAKRSEKEIESIDKAVASTMSVTDEEKKDGDEGFVVPEEEII